tara:strand:+ start:303 stop:1277 length:975 start_codon:yes stop_codon:yes gene_type:complete
MGINNLVDRNLKANVTNGGAGAGLDAQSFQNFLGSPALSNTFKVSLGLSNNSSGQANSDLNAWLVSSGVFNKSSPSRFDFLCSEASLPGTNLASFEETGARQGVTEFFANSRAYVDLNLRFYLSADYQVLKLFQEWINFINPVYAANGGMTNVYGNPQGYANQSDRYGFHRFRYPNSYKRTIMVTKFERNIGADKRGRDDHLMQSGDGSLTNRKGVVQPSLPPDKPNPLTYIFVNAFPESVDSIQLSYGEAQVLQVTANFKYDRYVVSQADNNAQSQSTEWRDPNNRTVDGQVNVQGGNSNGSASQYSNGQDVTGYTVQNENKL